MFWPRRVPRQISAAERGQFLLDYVDLLMNERVGEAEGFRHVAPRAGAAAPHNLRAGTIAG